MKTIYRNLLILLSACLFACQSEDEFSSSNIGYLYLNIGESQNTNTKAVSENYNPKQIAVQIIDANNQVVKETDDWTTWEGEQIALKPGTYTIGGQFLPVLTVRTPVLIYLIMRGLNR